MSFGTLGAWFAFLGVLAGAFGAHTLRARLSPELLQVFETGVRYQLVHALALILLGLAGERGERPGLRVAGVLFAAGIVVFSGSLYALALTGIRGFGAITPLGGLCFLAGWLLLARALARRA